MKIYTHQAKNDLMHVGPPIRFGGARYQPSYPLENFLSEALSVDTIPLCMSNDKVDRWRLEVVHKNLPDFKGSHDWVSSSNYPS